MYHTPCDSDTLYEAVNVTLEVKPKFQKKYEFKHLIEAKSNIVIMQLCDMISYKFIEYFYFSIDLLGSFSAQAHLV